MMEIDDELAYQIHGIINSESDSDSDDREFDEEYNLLKPPPYNYELIKDKIIVISSQKTPVILNYWQDQSINIENDAKINKIETTNNVAVSKNTKNAVLNNFTVLQAINVQNYKTNTGRENVDLYGLTSSNVSNFANCMANIKVKSVDRISSRNKKKFRKSYVKSNDLKTIERKKIGFKINTKEELEKEFPSLDEVSKNNFKKKENKIIRTESIASTSSVSGKKKKQFKPLPIEINYSKNIPNVEYVKISKKNIKRQIGEITTNKINFNVPVVGNEINNHKRKMKKTPKQSIKVLSKNLIDKTSGIEDVTKKFKETKNDNKTQMPGTEVLTNDEGLQEIECTKLNFEDSISLHKEECELAMFNNMNNKIVATNLMDFEEPYINRIAGKKREVTSKLKKSISEMECANSFQAITQNVKLNKNKVKTEKQNNENLANISKGQQMKKILNQTNDFQENVDLSKENNSINFKLGSSLNDHRDVVQYKNIFDGAFKNFLQNIVYEGTGITDLNCFTYEQLHLAYTAYLRKNAMENSSDKAEHIIRKKSSQTKKSTTKKEVKQPNANRVNKLYQQNKNDSGVDTLLESDFFFFNNEFDEYNTMTYSRDLMYDELIDFMTYMQEIKNINTDGNIVMYLPGVNINFYLGMKSLTYISTRFANDKKSYAYINKHILTKYKKRIHIGNLEVKY